MIDAKLYNVIRAPRVSEKTARLQEVSNQYVFEVATDATKADIKVAVRRADWRKAYVKLAEGQSIDVMAKA
jgi:large subunit ribosomal protein L23